MGGVAEGCNRYSLLYNPVKLSETICHSVIVVAVIVIIFSGVIVFNGILGLVFYLLFGCC